MKQVIFVLIALIFLFVIIVVAVEYPPEVMPKNNVPIIETTTNIQGANNVTQDVNSSGQDIPNENQNTDEFTLGSKRVVLRLEELISYNDIDIVFASIKEDSRCPTDVQCIQAGRVIAIVSVSSLSGEHILDKELEEGGSFYAGSTLITLSGVTPKPVSTKQIKDGEYRFDVLLEVVE